MNESPNRSAAANVFRVSRPLRHARRAHLQRACHAPAVAELDVVRRFLASSVNERRLTLFFLCAAFFGFGAYLGFYVADRRQRCMNAISTINQFMIRSRFATEPTPPQLQHLENSLVVGSITELQRTPRWIAYFIALGEADSEKRQAEKTTVLIEGLRRAGASLPDEQVRQLMRDYIGRHYTYEAPKPLIDALNELRDSQHETK